MKDKSYREMIRDKIKEVRVQMDYVNHPPHYNASKIETIDIIESATEHGFEYYLQGNIIKYMVRYRHKNGIQDLKKAQWYLNKLIEVKNDITNGNVHTKK
tara:strand:+ start:486 stop:785 length:300 start_codon:yes stop_codon:yes gene_type:complete